MYKIFSLNNKLKQYLTIDLDKLYVLLNTSSKGLKSNQILLQRKNFGDNNFNNLDHSFTKQHLYRTKPFPNYIGLLLTVRKNYLNKLLCCYIIYNFHN